LLATGAGAQGNINVIHSKLLEQQQIINKHLDKERRYIEKIK
jgi:hypothetical protein